MKTLEYKENPTSMHKPYLHAKPAPTRKALTYSKTLEHKQNPNLHEKTLPYQLNELSWPQ